MCQLTVQNWARAPGYDAGDQREAYKQAKKLSPTCQLAKKNHATMLYGSQLPIMEEGVVCYRLCKPLASERRSYSVQLLATRARSTYHVRRCSAIHTKDSGR